MSLETDQWLDRRRLKRRLSMWRIVAVVAVVALGLAATDWFTGTRGLTPRPYVARLDVEGVILDDPARDAALADVANDSNARALILYINSPGGSVVGGEALFERLRKVAAHKPVVAVMGDLATSAGYMTALGADRIFARAGSLTGSIGVILQSADITGLLDKLGIRPEIVKSAPLKAQPNPFEPFTPEARAVTKAAILDVFNTFVDMVAKRRSMSHDAVLKLADGRVFTGRQAVASGLIDALGGVSEARKWLADTRAVAESLPVRPVQIKRDDGLWRRLVESTVGKAVFSERLRLDGLVSLWHPDLW